MLFHCYFQHHHHHFPPELVVLQILWHLEKMVEEGDWHSLYLMLRNFQCCYLCLNFFSNFKKCYLDLNHKILIEKEAKAFPIVLHHHYKVRRWQHLLIKQIWIIKNIISLQLARIQRACNNKKIYNAVKPHRKPLKSTYYSQHFHP